MTHHPTDALGPLYDQVERILCAQRTHDLAVLREAGPDVWTDTDDGGAVHVHHDPAHDPAADPGSDPTQESLFGEDRELVVSADSPLIGELVTQMQERPYEFAASVLRDRRFAARLRDRLETVENAVSILRSPNYVR